MTKTKKTAVAFDPGFARYYPDIGYLIAQFNNLGSIKAVNQKKFQVQLLETNLIKPFTAFTAIFHGCVIYGSIIASRYAEDNTSISDNPLLTLPEEVQSQTDLTAEPKLILGFYNDLTRAIRFFLKREPKFKYDLAKYAEIYIKFIELNKHFIGIDSANKIILPDETAHFKEITKRKLTLMEKEIHSIIETGEIEKVLNIS